MLRWFCILTLLLSISCDGLKDLSDKFKTEDPAHNTPSQDTDDEGADEDEIDEVVDTGGGYQLDMGLEEIAEIEAMIGAPTSLMGISGQMRTYAFNGSGQAFYYALPANTFYHMVNPGTTPPARLDFSSGIRAFELEFSIPERSELGGSFEIVGGLAYDMTSSGDAMVRFSSDENGLYYVAITGASGSLFHQAYPYASLPSRIGFELNAETSTFEVYFDGVKQTLIGDNTYSFPSYLGVIGGSEWGMTAGNIGKVISARLITTAADMTTPFSPGVTDPFGNPIQ